MEIVISYRNKTFGGGFHWGGGGIFPGGGWDEKIFG